MATVTTAALVAGLISAFVKSAEAIGAQRIALGDAVLALWKHLSKAETAERLRDAIPDERARMLLGRVITPGLLNDLATTASTFRENEGLAHGNHILTREDVARLDVKPAELAEIASAAAEGKVRVKDVHAATKGGKSGEKALARIRQTLAASDEPALTPIQAKQRELEQLDKRITDLQAKRKKVIDDLAKMREEREAQAEVNAAVATVQAEQPKRQRPQRKPSEARLSA